MIHNDDIMNAHVFEPVQKILRDGKDYQNFSFSVEVYI